MAIWQFEFYLIDKDDGQTIVQKNIFKIIEKYYEKNKHWSENYLLFGNQDGTCFEFFDDEIFVRLDVRDLSKENLNMLNETINKMNKKILYRNNMYPSNNTTLIELIKESDSYKFCTNPTLFLENLNKSK